MWISKKNLGKEVTKTIQAMTEGEREDALTAGGFSTRDEYVDKNNYPTYTKQIQIINQMYNAETEYGVETLRSIVDTRCSFIGGAGISVKGSKNKTIDFVTKFLDANKMLKGSELLNIIKIGEMEGKCLITLRTKKIDEKEVIKTTSIDYYNNPYKIEMKDKEITKITLGKGDGAQGVAIDKATYIKLGGSPDRINETPPRMACILTDIVNFSRAKYDMRGNNHLYGRPQWVALTETQADAKALQNTIKGLDMTRSKSYVGTAKQIFYLEPSGKAQEVLEKEMLMAMRIISMDTGIPIHWLSWPDLMSNRATAENMLEMINSATIQERLIYEEGFKDLVKKAMILGVEKGVVGAVNDPDGFELKLDLISYANLKQIQETWIPLAEGNYISHQTAQSLIPGIDPQNEQKLIEKEKEDRVKEFSIMRPNMFPKEEGEKEDDTETKQTADERAE